MIEISKINKKDLNVIVELEQLFFLDPMNINNLKIFLQQDNFEIWKISYNTIIGYISLFRICDDIEIIRIAIIESFQRKGFGTTLIKKILDTNVNSIILEVAEDNFKAISFYKRLGFIKVGERKSYYKINQNNISNAHLFKLKVS